MRNYTNKTIFMGIDVHKKTYAVIPHSATDLEFGPRQSPGDRRSQVRAVEIRSIF
jgi:hypothetical protein